MAITDEAIGAIKEMIASGELAPGDRLPREPELAAKLKVSRSSLREAVRALTHVRVLSTRQGDGTYVTSLESDLLLEAVGLVSELFLDDTLLELYEVRRILEPAATALAAQRIDVDTLDRVRAGHQRMLAAEDVDGLIACDLVFHEQIIAAAGNRTLASLMANVVSGGMLRARAWRAIVADGAIDETKAQHEAILRALVDRDPVTAHAAATMHLVSGDRWFREATKP